ncbi:MAG: hypothetical protein V4696_13010 [Pseudomonadota bacterium]
MLNFDPNQVVIYALVFVLGLLVGGFLFTGGGRKWKGKYNAEVERRKEIEARHVQAKKDWREQESLRAAAEKNRPVVASSDPRDTNRDGVVTPAEKPGIMDRMLGRDRDGDGVPDNRDPVDDRGNITTRVDRDGDGVDDRRQ